SASSPASAACSGRWPAPIVRPMPRTRKRPRQRRRKRSAMAAPSLLRIERLNYALGGILVILAAVTQPRPIALGIAVGVALTCLNFFVLRKLVFKWTSDAAKGKTGNA